ncbi:hypothetical protein BRADI_1g10281v3, partial [Brachypodium distachyon]
SSFTLAFLPAASSAPSLAISFPTAPATASAGTTAPPSAWHATSRTLTPTRSTSTRSASLRNWSARSGHVASGTPAQSASSAEFQPQWLTNPPTAPCARISPCGAHRPATTMPFLDARSSCKSSPSSELLELAGAQPARAAEAGVHHRPGFLPVEPLQYRENLRGGAVVVRGSVVLGEVGLESGEGVEDDGVALGLRGAEDGEVGQSLLVDHGVRDHGHGRAGVLGDDGADGLRERRRQRGLRGGEERRRGRCPVVILGKQREVLDREAHRRLADAHGGRREGREVGGGEDGDAAGAAAGGDGGGGGGLGCQWSEVAAREEGHEDEVQGRVMPGRGRARAGRGAGGRHRVCFGRFSFHFFSLWTGLGGA